jgi:hypothetical protein
MHALCVLVVACAVAAGSGTGQGEVRTGALPRLAVAPTRGATPSLRTAAVHPALHAVLLRNGRPRSARASHPSLPPVALAAGWSIDPLQRVVTAPARPAGGRWAGRRVRTGSARGPPIA